LIFQKTIEDLVLIYPERHSSQKELKDTELFEKDEDLN
jgi:hypothetical protein